MLQNHENFHIFMMFTTVFLLIKSCTHTRGNSPPGSFCWDIFTKSCSILCIIVKQQKGLFYGFSRASTKFPPGLKCTAASIEFQISHRPFLEPLDPTGGVFNVDRGGGCPMLPHTSCIPNNFQNYLSPCRKRGHPASMKSPCLPLSSCLCACGFASSYFV